MELKTLLKSITETTFPETISGCHESMKLMFKVLQAFIEKVEQLELENSLLKEQLNLNSQNSSLSPSKDWKKKKKPKGNHHSSGRPGGGQAGHPGHFRSLVEVEEVDTVVKCELPVRCECGGKIKSSEEYQRHQVYELPEIHLHITEYQLMRGRCLGCCQQHVADLPEGVSFGITGARLTSMMSMLVSDYKLSRRELQRFLKEYLHFELSLGTVFNKQRLVNGVLKEPVEALLEAVQKSLVLHSDETGHHESSQRHWLWTLANQQMAYFAILKSRGRKALNGLLETFEGIVVSDRHAVYNAISSSHHQLCWSHLKRDFTRLSEKSDVILAKLGKGLLAQEHRLFQYWYDFKQAKISRPELITRCEPIRRRIGELLEQGTYTDPALRAVRLCRNLLNQFDALWTFLYVEGVEPTNNHAERCLRPWVIWRKKYFGTRSTYGMEYVARSASLITTSKLQKQNPFDYLTQAIHQHFSHLHAPPIVPA